MTSEENFELPARAGSHSMAVEKIFDFFFAYFLFLDKKQTKKLKILFRGGNFIADVSKIRNWVWKKIFLQKCCICIGEYEFHVWCNLDKMILNNTGGGWVGRMAIMGNQGSYQGSYQLCNYLTGCRFNG